MAVPRLARPLRLASSGARIYARQASSQASSGPSTNALRTGVYATAFALSAGLFGVYYFDTRSSIHRYVIPPLVRGLLDPETGHKLAVQGLRCGLGPTDRVPDDESLTVELWGRTLKNPVGLAAGFDKDGEAVDGLLDLGFCWVEIGSVTPRPQSGNPRPRFFHLSEDDAVINRYGFPSQGHASVLSRLRARIPSFLFPEQDTATFRPGTLLAVNLGKNKDAPLDSVDDFVAGVRAFGTSADVLVVNVSSPNTPGLRGLQERDLLQKLLSGVSEARTKLPASDLVPSGPKLLLKLSPDLTATQLTDIADVVRNSAVDGVIVSNTTIQRPAGLRDPQRAEAGGLSGPPLKPIALAAVRILRSQLPASVPIIGCGGISSGADALEYARAGATMVQIYTAFGYDGTGTVRRIKDEISAALTEEGTTWMGIVNKALKEKSWVAPPPPPKRADSAVGMLIEEAEELQRMLGELEAKMALS
ncbi:Dihydroorotate dehydrogenase-domain-containing protein [Schizophyllum amplum]|uniref:Dihydroorotate dehydrogenase (quinone), mitochondrial n=1 Tax=Schizophyllum amplum TaxID=97359 RepID=A0A550CKR6_9AGAR|nr:Dihydroorotate dehydrogenase-domain-containing protein [Auriculariopsis ampla]